MAPKQWEYWVRQMPYDVDLQNGRKDIENELNELGKDGWNLVNITYRQAFVVTVLKRRTAQG
jgi:hypothetical protein